MGIRRIADRFPSGDALAGLVAPVARHFNIGEVEAWARRRGISPIVGVDEVGKGALAGPVVAGACVLPAEHGLDELNDSKQLTAAQRADLAPRIKDMAIAWGVGVRPATEIDRIGINPATFGAMRDAVGFVVDVMGRPKLVVVDGHLEIRGLRLPQRTWQKGDARSYNIAAASVLAKVHRDEFMVGLDATFPGYGFGAHKGYGTPEHQAGLKRLGPCAEHRRSFRGVVGPPDPAA